MILDMANGQAVTADEKWHRLLKPEVVWRTGVN